MAPVTGKTTVTGIIGHPVRHSLSPVMHNAAFAALGLDWIYVPFPVHPDSLPAAVAGLAALGVAGFNVTIPHKVAILPLLDRVSPEAELVGAVNVVALQEGVLVGYNTDGLGLLEALKREFGFSPAGRNVLVLGAGGAARGAVAALGSAGAARICLANRTLASARELVAGLAPRLPDLELGAETLELLGDPSRMSSFDLIVNTTSVGMAGDCFAGLNLAGLKPGLCVYDMVYAPPLTPLLARARELGIPAANGIGMLVAQGEAAFKVWTGQAPPEGCLAGALAALGMPGIP
jgi:shikimate dehydrogenase